MRGTNRIIINTIILYVKIIVCMVISLWTVPLFLKGLGEQDFGVFNLVAGIVAMLAFLNGAMTVSTQRFLSVTIGEKDNKKLQEVFNLSIVLHIILGIFVVVLIEASVPFLIEHVINIPQGYTEIVRLLFHYLAVSICFTIIAVPFDAVLNSYENMAAFSIFGIIESLMRLAIALAIQYIDITGRLNFYGYCSMFIALAILLLKYIYTSRRYKHLSLSYKYCKNKKLFFELCGFAGWNALNSIAIIGRNQGIALTLNHFLGATINAAYGIGNQINGVLGYFSQTIQKSITPQLMESHGAHDKNKLEAMTFGLTKYSTLSMGIVAIPLFVEMPFILNSWLPIVPSHTISFSRYIIILSLLFQLSSGLMSAVQSSGKIKWYTICICITLISIIPTSYLSLKTGSKAVIALQIACAFEVIAFIIRLFFAKKLTDINTNKYITTLVLPLIATHTITTSILYLITTVIQESFIRLILNSFVGVILFCFVAYYITLTKIEKEYIHSISTQMKNKIIHKGNN